VELQKEYQAWIGFGNAVARMLIKDGSESLSPADSASIKHLIGSSYDKWADGALSFWNWGLHDDQLQRRIAEQLPEFDRHDSDGYSEQLYYYTMSHLPVAPGQAGRARKILEVGSGSGAGLNFLARLEPQSTFTGVDLTRQAVTRATARFSRPGIVSYVNGDAENLPFADSEFDAVINVESSHNYPNLGAFLSEVTRVLKPGGSFSFVDFFTDERLVEFKRTLSKETSALRPTSEHDISELVRAAIRRRMEPHSMFRAQVKKSSPMGTRFILEPNAMLQYGSAFASSKGVWNMLPGTGMTDGLRVVAKLTSYRHFLATKSVS
jgi:ubiquinone/menaquinone biosynthesis C-methylase UbiE